MFDDYENLTGGKHLVAKSNLAWTRAYLWRKLIGALSLGILIAILVFLEKAC
jgi:hypothetical protein